MKICMKICLNLFCLIAALTIGTSTIRAEENEPHPPMAGHLIFKNDTLHFKASFWTPIGTDSEVKMLLEARDPRTHQPTRVTDEIAVKLWMPSMNHGSGPTLVEPAKDSAGQAVFGSFLVRKMYFIMPGEWEVIVTLTDGKGIQESKSFLVTL